MVDFRMLPAGDTAFVVEFGDRIERALSSRVLALASRIELRRLAGVIETLPTFCSLMVSYDPAIVDGEQLQTTVATLIDGAEAEDSQSRLWRLPVCYHESLAPDLSDVAARTGLSVTEVVERHTAITHHVYMLGFLPGQPYLGDLPDALALPRRQTPRAKVSAGSVGIAMKMTCVFPNETPCGLNVIGRTPVALWDLRRKFGSLLSPGDKVIFDPVTLAEFEALTRLCVRGALQVLPTAVAELRAP